MSEHRKIKHTGFQRILRATDASIKGARYVYVNEAAFRQEVVLATISLVTCLFFFDNWFSLLAVISSWILVFIIEILNTAIETVVDRISLELHPLSGAAKDLGSFAVALSLVNALGWWVYAVSGLCCANQLRV